jgi:diguanylate cyclase (GGDEF)-like protein
MVARLVLRRHFVALLDANRARTQAIYIALLLSNSLLWGVLTALALHWPPLESIRWPLWLVAIGVTAAGAMGMSIINLIRWTYPTSALGPIALALLLQPTPEQVFLALMTMLAIAYFFKASKAVHDDYWSAAEAHWELKERSRRFERLSITDALTQLHNRLFFEHRLAEEWAHAARTGQALSILMVDIDHFKRVNDSFGHPFGDRCLRAVADALRRALQRSGDVLARYGGEEFIVLLRDADEAAARQVAGRLLESVSALALPHDGETVRLTCSIGCASARPLSGGEPAAAVNDADQALYRAKLEGRNRVVHGVPVDLCATRDTVRVEPVKVVRAGARSG